MNKYRSTSALTGVLVKIFVNGFYKVHAGLFLFGFLVIVGAVEPSQILNYHKLLMRAFISSPLMLLVVFMVWLLYAVKTWHYVAGQIFAPNQAFLFYSSSSFSKTRQLWAWGQVQLFVLAPVAVYGLIAVGVGLYFGYLLGPLLILIYLALQTGLGAYLYLSMVNRLVKGGSQSVLLRWSKKWRKPYFSLYIFQVFDQMKGKYLLIKGLSYLIVIGVFALFADVSHDTRVAGIAVLAIVTAHTVIIFELRGFEEGRLSFSRNLPYSRAQLFMGFIGVYACLLLPEAIWMMSRFSPGLAVQLILLGLSLALLFHGLLYWMGLNMDKYLQWILGLFMVLFWVILFKLLPWLIVFNFVAGLLLFYRNYYRVPRTI